MNPNNRQHGQKREIPFSIPFIDQQEIDEVTAVLKGKWITTGAKTAEFEALMRDSLRTPVAIAVSSGTAAMQVSLAALGIGPGDDILTSAYTFASTALAIIHLGAAPIFADVDPDTFNLDPEKTETLIAANYRPSPKGLKSRTTGHILKGILPVHFGGQPAEMDAINAIAQKYGLFVVEDAAHAVGARYKNVPVGQSPNLVCFSFYSNKNLTTGEGGMIATTNSALEKKLRMYALHGISKTALERYKTGLPFYDVAYPGFKANLTDIQAALGVVQAKKLPEIIRLRTQAAQWYNERLKNLHKISIPLIQPYNHSAFHLYPILVDDSLKTHRDAIIIRLREEGVFPSVHFIPVHFHSFFKSCLPHTPLLPVTENLFYREISLPVYPEISKEDIDYVASALEKILSDL